MRPSIAFTDQLSQLAGHPGPQLGPPARPVSPSPASSPSGGWDDQSWLRAPTSTSKRSLSENTATREYTPATDSNSTVCQSSADCSREKPTAADRRSDEETDRYDEVTGDAVSHVPSDASNSSKTATSNETVAEATNDTGKTAQVDGPDQASQKNSALNAETAAGAAQTSKPSAGFDKAATDDALCEIIDKKPAVASEADPNAIEFKTANRSAVDSATSDANVAITSNAPVGIEPGSADRKHIGKGNKVVESENAAKESASDSAKLQQGAAIEGEQTAHSPAAAKTATRGSGSRDSNNAEDSEDNGLPRARSDEPAARSPQADAAPTAAAAPLCPPSRTT